MCKINIGCEFVQKKKICEKKNYSLCVIYLFLHYLYRVVSIAWVV